MLAIRATRRPHRRAWWGTPQADLVVMTIFAVAGRIEWGIAAAMLYAGATLTAAIESLRGDTGG